MLGLPTSQSPKMEWQMVRFSLWAQVHLSCVHQPFSGVCCIHLFSLDVIPRMFISWMAGPTRLFNIQTGISWHLVASKSTLDQGMVRKVTQRLYLLKVWQTWHMPVILPTLEWCRKQYVLEFWMGYSSLEATKNIQQQSPPHAAYAVSSWTPRQPLAQLNHACCHCRALLQACTTVA